MEAKKMNYYLLKDSGLVAKGYSFYHWIYHDFAWHKDRESIVSDKLFGYDPSEPEGSPYGIGSTSIMDEIEQISYETATNILAEQIITNLIHKWSEQFREQKKEWDRNPEWPAKLVETSFCLFDTRYTLKPEDLGLKNGPEDEGFMESIQKELEKDLIAVGATAIESIGFLD